MKPDWLFAKEETITIQREVVILQKCLAKTEIGNADPAYNAILHFKEIDVELPVAHALHLRSQ